LAGPWADLVILVLMLTACIGKVAECSVAVQTSLMKSLPEPAPFPSQAQARSKNRAARVAAAYDWLVVFDGQVPLLLDESCMD
jgi:hypothetical protein